MAKKKKQVRKFARKFTSSEERALRKISNRHMRADERAERKAALALLEKIRASKQLPIIDTLRQIAMRLRFTYPQDALMIMTAADFIAHLTRKTKGQPQSSATDNTSWVDAGPVIDLAISIAEQDRHVD